ncbi:hypothetical protein [Tenacibaculum xiamenense]|uniref:hypothetical protein n=1 Tax=Tenacibaculum xiamenense TaxID=1261553 RepID=UPI003895E399
MKKTLLIVLLTLYSSINNAQELISEFNHSLKTSRSKQKDIYPLVNTKDNSFSIFIADAKKAYCYKFDNNFRLTHQLQFDNKLRKYKQIIGYSFLENGDYKVYLKNKKNDFLEVSFLFEEKRSTSKEFKLLTDYETYLQSFTLNNKFYLVSSAKKVNGLYFYTFDTETPKRNKIDLTKIKALSIDNQKVDLMSALLESKEPLLKFDQSSPQSIVTSSTSYKMFLNDRTVTFLLNNNSNFTQILRVNIDDFSANFEKINNPLETTKRRHKKSNAFLNNDHLFSLAVSKDSLKLKITPFNDRENFTEYSVSKKDSIDFKNSSIRYSAGGKYKKNTSKNLIRQMRYGKPSINVISNNNKYNLTIGCVLPQTTYFGPALRVGFSDAGFTSTRPSYGIHFGSFIDYALASDYLLFSSILDSNLNHLKDEKTDNVYEKVKDYLDPNRTEETLKKVFHIENPFKSDNLDTDDSIFKYLDYYIYIDYNKKTNSYKLLKFEPFK